MQSVESAQELRLKLSTYNEQLEQIEELLAQDSGNEDLQKLKSDLVEVIKLTTDLLGMQTGNGTSATAQTAAIPAVTPAESGKLAYQNPDEPIRIGSRVEVLNNQYYQPAIVRDILDAGEHYIVGFYSSLGEGETVDADAVRKIQPATRRVDLDSLAPGSQVSAKWAADGFYYDATIVGFTADGVQVTYDAYSYTDHVPPEYLAVRTRQSQFSQQAQAQRAMPAKKGEQDAGSKELVIPEHLKILPTDSEKEKERKRKKIKALKNKARIRGQEEESKEKQSSWQSFVSKGKNRKAGFITTKRKESIFASPDTVEGKVGVTGSGHGMTDYERRKKHKTDIQLDEEL